MAVSKSIIAWHVGSATAGAVAALSFASTHTVDLYAVFDQMKTVYGDMVKLIGMLTPFATIAAAAYRTYNTKRVDADTVSVKTPDDHDMVKGQQVTVIPSGGGIPVIGKVAASLLLALLLSSLLALPASAQARKPQFTGNIVKDVIANNNAGLGILSPGEILKGIGKISLPDLLYAQAQARAAGNKVTEPCWTAWVNVIQTAQQVQKDAQGQPLDLPDPHLFTDVESASEMLQALQPGGAIQVGCGPMADALKKSIMQVASAVVTGGSALTTLVPVIP